MDVKYYLFIRNKTVQKEYLEQEIVQKMCH